MPQVLQANRQTGCQWLYKKILTCIACRGPHGTHRNKKVAHALADLSTCQARNESTMQVVEREGSRGAIIRLCFDIFLTVVAPDHADEALKVAEELPMSWLRISLALFPPTITGNDGRDHYCHCCSHGRSSVAISGVMQDRVDFSNCLQSKVETKMLRLESVAVLHAVRRYRPVNNRQPFSSQSASAQGVSATVFSKAEYQNT